MNYIRFIILNAKKLKISFSLSTILIVFLLFPYIVNANVGDPVPGAEVYIEQEPNEEPVVKLITNKYGKFSATITLRPGKYRLYVNNKNRTIATSSKSGFAIGGFSQTLFCTDCIKILKVVKLIQTINKKIQRSSLNDNVIMEFIVRKKGKISFSGTLLRVGKYGVTTVTKYRYKKPIFNKKMK